MVDDLEEDRVALRRVLDRGDVDHEQRVGPGPIRVGVNGQDQG